MKNLVTLIALIGCMLAPTAFADEDTSVSIEFIWGIGGTTSHKGFALRAGRDNAEIHLAHWFGARSNTALGIGLTARTENDGQRGNKFYHVSGTVGLAYVFQTNSVLSDHFQPYLRVALGNDLESDGDVEFELSYSRYGFESAENFGGIGLRFNDRYEALKSNTKSHKPENPGNDDDDTPPDDVPPGPPGDTPPDDVPPGDVPPGDVPPGDVPPGDVPPGPPSDVPPGPPSDVPPGPPGDIPPGPPSDDDGNNGHGNNEDGCDGSNPGNGGPPSCG